MIRAVDLIEANPKRYGIDMTLESKTKILRYLREAYFYRSYRIIVEKNPSPLNVLFFVDGKEELVCSYDIEEPPVGKSGFVMTRRTVMNDRAYSIDKKTGMVNMTETLVFTLQEGGYSKTSLPQKWELKKNPQNLTMMKALKFEEKNQSIDE